jgi:hypothetical protein
MFPDIRDSSHPIITPATTPVRVNLKKFFIMSEMAV